MPESKKGVYQIGINSFLFYNTPEIFYNLSLEEIEESKIKIIIVKILENSTNIFDTVVDFSEFGTGDNSSKDTIKNLDFIIFNYNFLIKEEENKINILFNTKSPKKIELFLHKLELEEDNNDLMYNEQMQQIQNKLQKLKEIAEKQEEEIKKLQQNEDNNLNKINYLGKFTKDLLTKIENESNNNQYNEKNNQPNNFNNNINNNQQNYNNNNQYRNNNLYNNNQMNNNKRMNNNQINITTNIITILIIIMKIKAIHITNIIIII